MTRPRMTTEYEGDHIFDPAREEASDHGSTGMNAAGNAQESGEAGGGGGR
jgi:hypothetical protein